MSKFAALAVAVDRPARMTILHPATGQPLCVLDEAGKPTDDVAWIDVLSADSAAAREYERAAQNKRLQSRARRITAEQLEADGVGLLAALTVGWRLVGLQGQPIDVPCTRENAAELYASPELGFIKRQVNDFAADLGNYPQATTSKI